MRRVFLINTGRGGEDACAQRRQGSLFRSAGSILLLFFLFLVATLAVSGDASELAQERAPEEPNVVYIVLDDADSENMERYMTKTAAMVRDKGATFENFYVAQPQCCPSRASALLGEYPHNHQIKSNKPLYGGWEKFRALGHEQRTIATVLEAQGYSTGLFGKYLSGYESTDIPSGWNYWFGKHDAGARNWDATNDDGVIEHYGDTARDYSDRVILNKVGLWISNRRGPFFAYVLPTAPHSPYVKPPGRDPLGTTRSGFHPPPSFNEADVSDKPSHRRDLPRLDASARQAIEQRHRQRAEMTAYLDGRVASLIRSIKTSGKLANTYVVVTSDNGWMEGEHREPESKGEPYEESVKVPLWISGPGIAPGTKVEELASNVDLFATFLDMSEPTSDSADARDGISLLSLARETGSTQRQRLLFGGDQSSTSNIYLGMVDVSHAGRKLKYVEYNSGEKELYDLSSDPYELKSQHETADPALVASLQSKLDALKSCQGPSCRDAEDAP